MAAMGTMVLPPTTIRAGKIKRIDLLLIGFSIGKGEVISSCYSGVPKNRPCSTYLDQSYRANGPKSINYPRHMGNHFGLRYTRSEVMNCLKKRFKNCLEAEPVYKMPRQRAFVDSNLVKY